MNNLVTVEYVPVQLPSVLNITDQSAILAFRDEITGVSQGECIELQEGAQYGTIALAFATAYSVAQSTALHISDGRHVLLFDHHIEVPIHLPNLDQRIWYAIETAKQESVYTNEATLQRELLISLPSLWQTVEHNDDIVVMTTAFVSVVQQAFRRAGVLHLEGTIPILPLLTAVYLSRPYADVVRYEPTPGQIIFLFF